MIKFDSPPMPRSPIGRTPFGRYDADSKFQEDAPKVAMWIARRLGWPTVDIEIDDEDIYAAFEEAIDQYSYIINEYNIRDNLFTLKGNSVDENVTGKYISSSSVSFMVKLAQSYGSMIGAGGDVKYHRDSITVGPEIGIEHDYQISQQKYDLKGYMENKLGTDRNVVIKKIFHFRSPAISRFYDPFVLSGMGVSNFMNSMGFGNMSPGSEWMLLPLNQDLLRIQAIEMNDKIRKSSFSFELVGGEVRIFPVPLHNFPLWFEWVYEDELMAAQTVGDASEYSSSSSVSGEETSSNRVVSDFSNAPYEFIPYQHMNAPSRRWILRYALAVAKHKLGMVRSKYDSVPSPLDSFRLDGESLKSEAKDEMRDLVEKLNETLRELTKSAQMDKMAQEAQQLSEFLKKVPTTIYIG